jgi:hypothetical protein
MTDGVLQMAVQVGALEHAPAALAITGGDTTQDERKQGYHQPQATHLF